MNWFNYDLIILDTQLTYAKMKCVLSSNWNWIFLVVFYNLEIEHYSTYWIFKNVVPENVLPVCVRIAFIRLILSLKFCIFWYIDKFCIRQILHRVRGWFGIGMTYLEMNPEFLEDILQMIRLIYFSIQNDWNNLSFIFLSFFWQ